MLNTNAAVAKPTAYWPEYSTGTATQERYGDWIQTYMGRRFYPLDPRPEDVYIEDIAHALSLQCRYAGHVKRFYCVAEHSWHISHVVHPDNAFWGLLHDASEAYVSDIVRPLKHMPEMKSYRTIEDRVMRAIILRFGLSEKEPPNVKEMDRQLLWNEMRSLFLVRRPEIPYHLAIPNLRIRGWTPRTAEKRFLERYYQLGGTYA